MGILGNTFSTLFRFHGRSHPGLAQKLERALRREGDLKRELTQLQLRMSSDEPGIDVKMDLMKFDVAQEKAAVASLTAALLSAQEDLELEKANRSAAVHLLEETWRDRWCSLREFYARATGRVDRRGNG
jgi:hypothetical protein